MRILFTRFPLESAKGGAENHTMWLAAGLKNKGHTVRFLGSCPVLLQTFAASGFGAASLTVGPPPVTKWAAASFLWRRTEMLKKMRAAIEAMPELPEAVFMLSLSEKILLTDWLVAKGIKVFWIEHDRIGPWLTANPWLSALKRASAHATIICVSELSRRLYLDLGFDPSHVIAIPNGVPPSPPPAPPTPLPKGEGGARDFLRNGHSSLHDSGERWRLSAGERAGEGLGVRVEAGMRLSCIARLSPEKGIDVLLQAIAGVPEVDLTILGSGSEEGYLRSLITEDTQRMGGERVRLRHSVSTLDDLYAAADVLVLPSRQHDPFGLVAAEAMMRGVPVIVTDACGIAGYLKDGIDALVVKADDVDALTAAVRRMIDPALRAVIAQGGQTTAKDVFSLEKMVDAYELLLR